MQYTSLQPSLTVWYIWFDVTVAESHPGVHWQEDSAHLEAYSILTLLKITKKLNKQTKNSEQSKLDVKKALTFFS